MGSSPFTLRWGIMATGWIAEMLAKDLLTNPVLRGSQDVRHVIAAVGSSSPSSALEKCNAFLKTINCPYTPSLHASYHALVADQEVDIVYVATPHSHHFQNAMLALRAGKHVLCEKAFTVTASQARLLVAEARSRNLFLMEAVWTRFFPIAHRVRELVAAGEVGNVYRVIADLSFARDLSQPGAVGAVDFDDTHRMVNRDLAGGALLDLGIYPLTWVMMALYHVQKPVLSTQGVKEEKVKPSVMASVNIYPRTGVDEQTTLVLRFDNHAAQGIATTSLRVFADGAGTREAGPAIRIQGSRGEIQVYGPAYRPLGFRVVKPASSQGSVDVQDFEEPIPADPERDGWGHGMFWEADECARCICDGRTESKTMPLDESVVIMEIMEEALKQGGIEYPELITSDVYEEKGKLNTGR